MFRKVVCFAILTIVALCSTNSVKAARLHLRVDSAPESQAEQAGGSDAPGSTSQTRTVEDVFHALRDPKRVIDIGYYLHDPHPPSVELDE